MDECLKVLILKEFSEWTLFMLVMMLNNCSGENGLAHYPVNLPAYIQWCIPVGE